MKSISLFLVTMVVAGASSFAQSSSYQTLKDKFNDQPAVHSFSLSGLAGRLVLSMAGEYEFSNAIKDLKHMYLITIPQAEFSKQHLSVNGFKKILKQDSFEPLAIIRDSGDEISIYLQEGHNHKNSYFVLVEEKQEVLAIELKGYLDPTRLNPTITTLAINK